ncbi:MAG: hypothetical protein NTX02_06775 [Planctomycetia bacterium]|nr:hypothetical protein [Planctomycetia bacterium]
MAPVVALGFSSGGDQPRAPAQASSQHRHGGCLDQVTGTVRPEDIVVMLAFCQRLPGETAMFPAVDCCCWLIPPAVGG